MRLRTWSGPSFHTLAWYAIGLDVAGVEAPGRVRVPDCSVVVALRPRGATVSRNVHIGAVRRRGVRGNGHGDHEHKDRNTTHKALHRHFSPYPSFFVAVSPRKDRAAPVRGR